MTCESGKCTRHGLYHVSIMDYSKGVVLERHYCRAHLGMLAYGMEQLMAQHDPTGRLHDYLEIEYANV